MGENHTAWRFAVTTMTDMTVTTGLRGCQNRQFYYGRHIRTYLRTTGDAPTLMGGPIRLTRKKRKSEADLAERIGIARSTLQSIEKGHAKVEIGLVFEAATLVGVPLFVPEPSRLTSQKPGVNMVAPERSSRSWRAGWGRRQLVRLAVSTWSGPTPSRAVNRLSASWPANSPEARRSTSTAPRSRQATTSIISDRRGCTRN